jgi:hypothetical protein
LCFYFSNPGISITLSLQTNPNNDYSSFRVQAFFHEGSSSDLPLPSQIVRGFTQQFSVLYGEALAVKGEQSALETDVIVDMINHSPYPAVSSIAAQAFAALCNEGPSSKRTPAWIGDYIQGIFTRSFQITAGRPNTDEGVKLLESPSTVERLARALVCCHGTPLRHLEQVVDKLPHGVPTIVLKSCMLTSNPNPSRSQVASYGILIQNILQENFLEDSLPEVHPGIRNPLLHAAETSGHLGGYNAEQQNMFYQDLL